jgi:hypothetical protein
MVVIQVLVMILHVKMYVLLKHVKDTKNEGQYMVIQNIGAQQYREYSEYFPLRIKNHVNRRLYFVKIIVLI